MKQYLIRELELLLAGAAAGAGSYIAQNGFDLSEAGQRGLLVAVGMAVYGVLVKQVGDRTRPTVAK